jgi:hypothetical protein
MEQCRRNRRGGLSIARASSGRHGTARFFDDRHFLGFAIYLKSDIILGTGAEKKIPAPPSSN